MKIINTKLEKPEEVSGTITVELTVNELAYITTVIGKSSRYDVVSYLTNTPRSKAEDQLLKAMSGTEAQFGTNLYGGFNGKLKELFGVHDND